MSRAQSRRSVSLVREDHAELAAFCEERRIPISQAVSQAIRALLAGKLPLLPARPMLEVMAETCARRGLPVYQRPRVTLNVPAISGTCGSCARTAAALIPTRIDGVLYRLCHRCHHGGELCSNVL